MKVLLINPPLDNLLTAGIPSLVGKRGFFPAMGLLYIAAYCRRNTGHDIEVIDAALENLNHKQLADVIAGKRPDLVGISTLTFTLVDSLATAETVKKLLPETKVVLGGIHVSLFPEESVLLPPVDFAVRGEGEITFSRLLDNIDNWNELRKIPGLLFKEKGRIVNTGPPGPLPGLDELPFPARDLTDYHKFSSYENNTYATTMIASRGCPFNCLFCFRPEHSRKLRFRSPENIVAEVENCLELGIREIHFYDDTFTLDRSRVIQFCDLIRERKLDFRWSIMTRVDLVDYELLTEMKGAGCWRIRFGVEAGTDEILKVLRKGITVEQAREAFRMTKAAGISTVAYFVIGSPSETEKQVRDTIRLALDLNADFTNFSIITIYPGTELYRHALDQKLLKDDIWQKFAANPHPEFQPPFWEENFTCQELIKMQARAYRAVYLRPGYMIRKMRGIRNMRSLVEMVDLGTGMIRNWFKTG